MADETPIVFVNSIIQAGFLNGIYNVAFTTARFTPVDGTASTNEFVSANLRMDLHCAQELHASLAKVIAQQTRPAEKEIN